MRKLVVDLGERSYPVLVGHGARHGLPEVLPPSAKKAAVVTQRAIDVAVRTGFEQETFYLGDGGDAKIMGSVEELCRSFSRFGLTRADVVMVRRGSGHRRRRLRRRRVPPRNPNRIRCHDSPGPGRRRHRRQDRSEPPRGRPCRRQAFWQPTGILCDTEVLSTLPAREYRSGLGEMAKYTFLGVPNLPELELDEAVARCVECKARFVTADERETESLAGTPAKGQAVGGRALLNYGRTLAHALEISGRYVLPRHGEAVAIGLVFAAHLAKRLGRTDEARVAEHDRVVAAYDLPVRASPAA